MSNGHQYNTTLFVIVLVAFELTIYFSVDIYLPALPIVSQTFNVSAEYAKWSMTSWLIGAGSAQLCIGPLADRIGRRPIVLAGNIAFIIASLLCSLTNDFAFFLFARFAQGVTICCVLVAGYACINEIMAEKEAITTLAWMNSITVLAPAVGPIIGVLLLTVMNWQHIFLLLALLALLTLLPIYRMMPETLPPDKKWHGGVREIARIYLSIMTNSTMMLNCNAFCAIFCVMVSWNILSPFLLQSNTSGFYFGLSQAYLYGLFILGTRIAALLIKHITVEPIIEIGLFFSTTGAVLTFIFSRIDWLNSNVGFVLPFGLFTFGAGILFPPLFRRTLCLSHDPLGTSMAIISCGMNIFAGLSSAVAISLQVKTTKSFSIFVIVLLLIAIACYSFAKQTRPLNRQDQSG